MCDQICSYLWIWSHLLKKSFLENLIFCAVPAAKYLPKVNKFMCDQAETTYFTNSQNISSRYKVPS